MHAPQPPPSAPRYRWRHWFGNRWGRGPAWWTGQGTAWLVFDAGRDIYHCYWFVGPADDHPVDRADVANAAAAVEWAGSRTPAARIRLPDHRTYWAGTAPNPGGFAGTWTTADPPPAPPRTQQPAPTPPRIMLAHTT